METETHIREVEGRESSQCLENMKERKWEHVYRVILAISRQSLLEVAWIIPI